jgi:SAM-dependent methyltransferase
VDLGELVKRILIKHVNRETGVPEAILIGWTDIEAIEEHLARYLIAQRVARGRVLDVASGSGYGSSILRRGRSTSYVVSVDIDSDLLRYGKKVFNITAVQADAVNLPFRDRSFDTVVTPRNNRASKRSITVSERTKKGP